MLKNAVLIGMHQNSEVVEIFVAHKAVPWKIYQWRPLIEIMPGFLLLF